MDGAHKKVLVVGISGVTCSGKTTVSMELSKILPDSKVFCQDDYYWPVDSPKHVWIPELNHINFDIVSSLDMERMTQDVVDQIKNESSKITIAPKRQDPYSIHCFESKKYDDLFKIKESQVHIIIVEGFCIFNYAPLAELCNLKYYFTLNYDECYRRRIRRVYEPPDGPDFFEKCAWPEHLKQIAEVREKIENVYFGENSTNIVEKVLDDIVKALK